ncbi:LysR family transcriptional regulator [Flindersiella endophytica]
MRQLEYFVAVAEERSFTQAAARVRVAQPGVSAQIRRLERELGETLFDRSGRTIRLTEVGAAVLPHAKAALAAVVEARQAVDELSGLVRGRVLMGTATAFPSEELDVPGLLADFHAEHPAVEISLVEAASDHLFAALSAGELDLALAALVGPLPPGIATQVVIDEPLVAAVTPDDPLATRAPIALEALATRTLICLPRGTGLRAVLDEAFSEAGIQPTIGFEASQPYALAQLASRGLGVAILPQSTATAYSGPLHVLGIVRPRLRGQIVLAWKGDAPISPAARTLVKQARARFA